MQNNVVVSQNEGPQYRPQNMIVLIMGTPIRCLQILGNLHVWFRGSGCWAVVLLALEVQVAARTTTHARVLIGLRKFGSRA